MGIFACPAVWVQYSMSGVLYVAPFYKTKRFLARIASYKALLCSRVLLQVYPGFIEAVSIVIIYKD